MKRILFCIFLFSFLTDKANSQNMFGFGSSIYDVSAYDMGVGIPITFTSEFNKSKAVKICGSLTFAYFLNPKREVFRQSTTTSWGYTYIQDYDITATYMPIDLSVEARRFFVGETGSGFGFFWSLGASERFNLGNYVFNNKVYDANGKPITEVPHKYTIPSNYITISFGYKFDMTNCDIVLGYKLCAPLYALFFDPDRKDPDHEIRNKAVALASVIYLNFVFGKKDEEKK